MLTREQAIREWEALEAIFTNKDITLGKLKTIAVIRMAIAALKREGETETKCLKQSS